MEAVSNIWRAQALACNIAWWIAEKIELVVRVRLVRGLRLNACVLVRGHCYVAARDFVDTVLGKALGKFAGEGEVLGNFSEMLGSSVPDLDMWGPMALGLALERGVCPQLSAGAVW